MENTTIEIASYQAKFVNYLFEQKFAETSVKSTTSDLEEYFSWITRSRSTGGFRLSQSNTLSSLFNIRALEQYFDYCRRNETTSGALRKFTALSSFIQYSVENKWLDSKLLTVFQMLAAKYESLLKAQQNVLADFKLALQASQNNPNTIRGYLADVAEYLQVNASI